MLRITFFHDSPNILNLYILIKLVDERQQIVLSDISLLVEVNLVKDLNKPTYTL